MDKENNIVYVQTKNGIFKCYKSEQMHKPIYYPIESKTNGYIDYYDVIDILNIDDLYEQVKKQKEIINKIEEKIKENIVNAKYEIIALTITDRAYYKYIKDMLNDLLEILEDKEVS